MVVLAGRWSTARRTSRAARSARRCRRRRAAASAARHPLADRRALAACAFPRCAATPAPATRAPVESSDDPPAARWPDGRSHPRAPGVGMLGASAGFAPARAPRARALRTRCVRRRPRSRGRQGHGSSTRSTSSGKTFSPSGVTIISFFRPRMYSWPSAPTSPMSPVWNQPSSNARAVSSVGVEVAARHVLAAHEDFSVGRDLHLDARDRLADRSLLGPERMVQADDRRGLGQPVALNDDEAELGPERLEIAVERRRADDERPELPAEQPVHAAVAPPAHEEVPAGRLAAVRWHRTGRGAQPRAARARAARRESSAPTPAPRRGGVLTSAAISTGLYPRMNTTTPGSIGGMKVAIAWPNMWLSGRRLRKRRGQNGVAHFRYFITSRSTGTMLARTFRWVMMTPFGSAVAPDVKMISATSSRPMTTPPGAPASASAGPSFHCSSWSFQTGASRASNGGTSWPIDDQPGGHDAADARQEIRRRAIVDRHDDDAAEEAAPERDDPLRTVLAPEDDLVAFPESERAQARGETARPACRPPRTCTFGVRKPSS